MNDQATAIVEVNDPTDAENLKKALDDVRITEASKQEINNEKVPAYAVKLKTQDDTIVITCDQDGHVFIERVDAVYQTDERENNMHQYLQKQFRLFTGQE